MREPRHGDIVWADLPEPAGRRPVLVLTRTAAIPHLTNVTVAPLTRMQRGIPSEVGLDRSDGVPTPCAASLDNIMTIPKSTLDRCIASLVPEKTHAVQTAIRYVFDMHD